MISNSGMHQYPVILYNQSMNRQYNMTTQQVASFEAMLKIRTTKQWYAIIGGVRI